MSLWKWLGVELVEVSFKEKLISIIGATVAIYSVFLITRLALPAATAIGVVASMGATAVLLFAVPHGQLSQPWPVIGGHLISATVGVVCYRTIADPTVATAVAVGAAIGLMHQFKCIHPPGGATAFTAVMGGEAIHELGFTLILFPVAVNALIMLIMALVVNYPFSWRRYPANLIQRPKEKPFDHELVSERDHRRIIDAFRSLDSFVDVSEDDLVYMSKIMANHLNDRRSGDDSIDVARYARTEAETPGEIR